MDGPGLSTEYALAPLWYAGAVRSLMNLAGLERLGPARALSGPLDGIAAKYRSRVAVTNSSLLGYCVPSAAEYIHH